MAPFATCQTCKYRTDGICYGYPPVSVALTHGVVPPVDGKQVRKNGAAVFLRPTVKPGDPACSIYEAAP